MDQKRRHFLQGSLLASGAVLAGAVEAAPPEPPKPPKEPKPPKGPKPPKAETYDVVVVGAGFAGMCAALEAAEQGAKTVLLEKMGRPDGTTVYSSGWIAAVGSRFQKNHPEDS